MRPGDAEGVQVGCGKAEDRRQKAVGEERISTRKYLCITFHSRRLLLLSAPAELDIVSHGAEQTRRLGAHLGALLEAGDVVLLEGEFGSGKTTFTQGVAAG